MPNKNPFEAGNEDPFNPFDLLDKLEHEQPASADPDCVLAHHLGSVAETQADLTDLVAKNPHLSDRDLASVFALKNDHRRNVSRWQKIIFSLVTTRPPKAGIANFIAQLRGILVASKYERYLQNFDADVQEAVLQLFTRSRAHGSSHDIADSALALLIMQTSATPVTDEIRQAAEKNMKEFIIEHRNDATAYLTTFNISSDFVKTEALQSFIYQPSLVTALREQSALTVPNNDQEFRERALEIVETCARFHDKDLDTFRATYEIPLADFKTALWKGSIKGLLISYDKNRIQTFQDKLEKYDVPLHTADPDARAQVIEGIGSCFDDRIDEAIALQGLFGITESELAGYKHPWGEKIILDHLITAKKGDDVFIKKVCGLLGISDEEVRALARTELRKKLPSSDTKETENWEARLCSFGYLRAEDHREDELQALADCIEGGVESYKLSRFIRTLGPERPLFNAERSDAFARQQYLKLLSAGRMQNAEELKEICDLSLVIGSADERGAAKHGMQYGLLCGSCDPTKARAISSQFSFTEAELQEAAEHAALTHLGAGWLDCLNIIRNGFDVEEVLHSDRAKKESGTIVFHELVRPLCREREERKFKSEYHRSKLQSPIILEMKSVDIVMKSIEIGGYDADTIETALRSNDGAIIPEYDEANLPVLLGLRRRCPGFCQAFERDDVRTQARSHITNAFEQHNKLKLKEHAELAGIPGTELTEIGLSFFSRYLSSDNPEKAFTFASAVDLDYTTQMSEVDRLLEENPSVVLRSLDVIPMKIIQKTAQKYFLADYVRDLGIPSENIYRTYVDLALKRDVIRLTAHVTSIKKQLDELITVGVQDPNIVSRPHYRELMDIVYSNNSGSSWTTFEGNEACEDRSEDLAGYVVRDAYHFTVSPGSDMSLKDGRQKNDAGLNAINTSIEQAHTRFEPVHFDRKAMLTLFDKDLEPLTKNLQPPEAFTTREEKLFGLLLEQSAGRLSLERFKETLITYQYAEFEDIRSYIDGTRGRAEKTRNPEYAYLLELREFFADRLKDVSRRIVERALENPRLKDVLPRFFKDIADREGARLDVGSIHKLQIDKLGLSPGFLRQIAKALKIDTGKEYSDKDVQALIAEYEERTSGMAEIEPPLGCNKVIYRQIRSQREKTIRALETLSGTKVHPSVIRLGEINLQQHLNERRSFQAGTYDEDVFSTYVSRQFNAVFQPELAVLDGELGKYEAKDTERKDAKPKRVEAFITKNHTSAHARGVSGVCVAGDNPRNDELNQWQMKNYFQMVLRDAETKLCKGCILLHLEEDNGKKILTASMNPSSTYLYQVNEEEMFKNLRAQLIVFAEDNNIDAIAVSRNPQIRTNRTGGLFERAMDQSITSLKTEHTFTGSRPFSFQPRYNQDIVDFIWMKESDATPASAE